MIEGGVQKPNGLGMAWHVPGRSEPKTTEAERTDRVLAQLRETADHAETLYAALRVAIAYAREQTPEGEPLPDDVEDGARWLARLSQYDTTSDVRDCPECEQGKHGNCDGQTMLDDAVIDCPCAVRGHA